MSTSPVCVHGGLRRKCETCDLADRLEHVEAQRDMLLAALRIAQELLARNGIVRPEIDAALAAAEAGQ